MIDEFGFEAEDLEFEDFHEEFENFDDEDSDDFLDLDDIQMRTAVLSKNNMVALLCVKTANQGGAICRVDPRENNPAVQLYDDAEKALDYYRRSLQTSRRNGWQIVYDGLPLQG